MCEEFANISKATENGFSWLAYKLELGFDYVVATSRATDIPSVLLTCFCWVLSRFSCYENWFHSSVVDVVRLEVLTTVTVTILSSEAQRRTVGQKCIGVSENCAASIFIIYRTTQHNGSEDKICRPRSIVLRSVPSSCVFMSSAQSV